MRSILILSFMVVAGCAGQPSAPPTTAAAAPATTFVDKNGTAVTQVSATNAAGDVDTKRLVDAKKAGYAVINKDGEPLFCRTDDILGSRTQKQTICLTAKQIDDMHAQTQQGIQQYMRTNAPVSGR